MQNLLKATQKATEWQQNNLTKSIQLCSNTTWNNALHSTRGLIYWWHFEHLQASWEVLYCQCLQLLPPQALSRLLLVWSSLQPGKYSVRSGAVKLRKLDWLWTLAGVTANQFNVQYGKAAQAIDFDLQSFEILHGSDVWPLSTGCSFYDTMLPWAQVWVIWNQNCHEAYSISFTRELESYDSSAECWLSLPSPVLQHDLHMWHATMASSMCGDEGLRDASIRNRRQMVSSLHRDLAHHSDDRYPCWECSTGKTL